MTKTFEECLEAYQKGGFVQKKDLFLEAQSAVTTFDQAIALYDAKYKVIADTYYLEEDDDLLALDCNRHRNEFLPFVLNLCTDKLQCQQVFNRTLPNNVELRKLILQKTITLLK